MDFESLVNTAQDFYGVCDTRFKLADTVWVAVEDEDDGYRSCLGCIEEGSTDGLVFPQMPFATVKIEKYDYSTSNGYSFTDTADGHIWLEVGTGNTDDYYPSFVFRYHPKEPTEQ